MMQEQNMSTMIASLRKAKGMTQAELADRLNVTDKAVSKWERGLSCPDIALLPKLAEIFGVSVDELMQVRETAVPAKKPTDIPALIRVILKGVAAALGIAVTVITVLDGELSSKSALIMLGLGLACLAVSALNEEK